MGELNTSVTIDLKGNLQKRARKFSDSIKKFSTRGQRDIEKLNRKTAKLNKSFSGGGMLRNFAPFATGAAAIGAGRHLLSLEERYERLGVQAKVSPEKATNLRRQVFETAQASDVRVDPTKVLGAIEEIVEKTGDLEFAQKNIRNLALAIQATGAEGPAIGSIAAELQKMGIKDPDEVLKVLDILTVQGKEGAFTLQNLARLGPRVITAYTSTGRTGTKAMLEMGAALQVIRMGTGNAEQAATAWEATIRTLTDPVKVKQLRDLAGIEVFDAEQLEKGKEVLRPINELLAEIIQKSKGQKTKLGTIFDAEAMRAFNFVGSEFQRTGKLDTLNKFMQVNADGSVIIGDSTRMAKTSNARIEDVKSTSVDVLDRWFNITTKFYSQFLKGPQQQEAKQPQPEGKLKVEIESKDAKVKVKSLQTRDMKVDVDTGSERMVQ